MHASTGFADRIANIADTGAVVCIEFGTLAPPASEGASPQLVPSQTPVMPVDGIPASVGMLESVVKTMIADGMLKPRPPAEPFAVPKCPTNRPPGNDK